MSHACAARASAPLSALGPRRLAGVTSSPSEDEAEFFLVRVWVGGSWPDTSPCSWHGPGGARRRCAGGPVSLRPGLGSRRPLPTAICLASSGAFSSFLHHFGLSFLSDAILSIFPCGRSVSAGRRGHGCLTLLMCPHVLRLRIPMSTQPWVYWGPTL